MQIWTLPQTDNHARTPPVSFLQARFPSYHPTNSIKALYLRKLINIVNIIYDLYDLQHILKEMEVAVKFQE